MLNAECRMLKGALAGALVVGWLLAAAPVAGQGDGVNSVHGCVARYPEVDASLRRMEAQMFGGLRAQVWAIVWVESQCREGLAGRNGEVGLGQVMPRDQKGYPFFWFGDRPTAAELADPLVNARTVGYVLLRNLTWFCGGDLACATRVYNGGTSGCVRAGGRGTRPMPAFGAGQDGCARAWMYGARVGEVAGMVK